MALDTAKEIKKFTAMYQDPEVSVDTMCEVFGYAKGSIYRMGFELGLNRPREKGTILKLDTIRRYCEKVSMELPPLDRAIAPTKYNPARDDLEFILLLSDEHAGRYTRSTNGQVYANRVAALGDRVIQQANRLSKWAAIGKLHIFKMGDGATGERIGLNVTLEELEHTVLEQCYTLAIPHETRMIERLLQRFKAIDVIAVPGNHGVVTRPQASKGANWDTVINLGLQAKLSKYPEITFNIATVDWYNFATVKNLDWLIMHGDQNKGACNYNSIASNVTQWHRSLPEHFDYVAMGHFHHYCKWREIFMNGTLLTDDDWSREVVKRDGECVQVLLAVSSTGIESIMPIWLDDVGEERDDLQSILQVA